MTIHRRLMERNLRSYRPLRHLPLTPAHCRAISQWFLSGSGWNHADCGSVVFSSESSFQLCQEVQNYEICHEKPSCWLIVRR
ncbi:hypothetical protein TNCV_4964671 [Trichonephila clavipes]|nr:hypothetical protein TNCV_4964671 [Trichonephila clavipes]